MLHIAFTPQVRSSTGGIAQGLQRYGKLGLPSTRGDTRAHCPIGVPIHVEAATTAAALAGSSFRHYLVSQSRRVPISGIDSVRIIGTVAKTTATTIAVKQTKDGKIISMKTDANTIVTRDKKKIARAGREGWRQRRRRCPRRQHRGVDRR